MSGAEIIAFDDDDLELKAGLIRARARLDASGTIRTGRMARRRAFMHKPASGAAAWGWRGASGNSSLDW